MLLRMNNLVRHKEDWVHPIWHGKNPVRYWRLAVCSKVLDEYFKIPQEVEKIDLILSSRPSRDGLKITFFLDARIRCTWWYRVGNKEGPLYSYVVHKLSGHFHFSPESNRDDEITGYLSVYY